MTKARLDAIALAKSFYSTGKPCRNGHRSDRYTSNGMCVECIKQQTTSRREGLAIARGRRVLAMAAGFTPYSTLVSPRDHTLFDELSEVMQVATPEQVEQLQRQIHALYTSLPTPRALNREDLLKFMDFNGKEVTNYQTLTLDETDDEVLYLIHNGRRYDAQACMNVLNGRAANVKPAPPKDTRPAWKPPRV